MAIVLDLIQDALKQIGALAIGETVSAEEAQDALNVLNAMLDVWRTESMMVYTIQENVFPLVSGQGVYTLGTGGNFNMPRPDRIVDAYARDTAGNDYKLYVTTDSQQYSDIISKYTTASIPTIIYDNGNFPLKDLSFWPVPSDPSYSAVLWTWGVLNEFSSVNETVTLPPGYKWALQTNLAYLLCPRYGVTNTAEIEKQAVLSKGQIKRFNTVVPEMVFPKDLTGTAVAFNWLTGMPQ